VNAAWLPSEGSSDRPSGAASARVWMRRGTAGMTSVRSTEPRHSARAPCSRCRKPITPVRIGLASALRAKQINVSRDCPLDEFAAGALGFRAQRATVRRSTGRPRPRHGRGSRCSRTQPRRRTIRTSLPSKLPVVARNRATSACRRLVSQVQTVVGLAVPNLTCRNAVAQDSRAAHQLATELPLCFEALFGLG
jgi:hypothetical protein